MTDRELIDGLKDLCVREYWGPGSGPWLLIMRAADRLEALSKVSDPTDILRRDMDIALRDLSGRAGALEKKVIAMDYLRDRIDSLELRLGLLPGTGHSPEPGPQG